MDVYRWLCLCSLSVVSIQAGTSDAIPILTPEGNVTVFEDEQSTLTCMYQSTTHWFRPIWKRNGVAFYEQWYDQCNSARNPPPAKSNHSCEKIPENDTYMFRLTIPAVNSTDEDQIWECVINVLRQFFFSRATRVILGVAPNVTILNGSVAFITEGDREATLSCSATGYPWPTMTWISPLGQMLKSPGPVTSLNYTLHDINRSHAGVYSCSAWNRNDKRAVAFVTVDVYYSPNVTITTGSTVTISEGDSTATLSCTAAGNPLPVITWMRVNKLMLKSPGPAASLDYILHDVERSQAGAYSCYASNQIGQSETKVLMIDVQYAPTVTIVNGSSVAITEGDRIATLSCHATGNPLPTVLWIDAKKQAFRSPYPTGTLDYTLYDVDRTYTGLYSCSAYNSQGTISAGFVEVEVRYIPDVRVTAQSGSVNDAELKITCTANGIPREYTLSWSHIWPGYGLIHHSPGLGDSRTLILTNLTYQHSGIYTCIARNNATGSKRPNAGYGNDFMLVESFPIVTDPILGDGERFLVAAPPGGDTVTIGILYFSNSANNSISCRIITANDEHPVCNYSWTKEVSDILLPVFQQRIPTRGTKTRVAIHLLEQYVMGFYDIVIRNTIGDTLFPVAIVPAGPPGAPEDVQLLSITNTSLILGWRSGFHGGFNQTIVIQLRKDTGDWQNTSSIRINISMYKRYEHVTVDTLIPDTHYSVRLYAYNLKGTSDYTDEMTFVTTERSVDANNETPIALLLIIGTSVIMVIIVAAVLSVLIIKRNWHMTRVRKIDQVSENVGNNGYITPRSVLQTRILPRMDTGYESVEIEDIAYITDNNQTLKPDEQLRVRKKRSDHSNYSKEQWNKDACQTSIKILQCDEGYLDMNIQDHDIKELNEFRHTSSDQRDSVSDKSDTVVDLYTAPTTSASVTQQITL